MRFTSTSIALLSLASMGLASPLAAAYPATSCKNEEITCFNKPNSNKSTCGAFFEECKIKCDNERTACEEVPNSNKSTCGANYAVCLGYDPSA